MLVCSNSTFGKQVFDKSMNGEPGSHACSHNAAHESRKPAANKPKHRVVRRSVSQNTLKKCHSSACHHIGVETEEKTLLKLSQLRALDGQLLWLGMQCLPQLLSSLSLLLGQTPQATVHTIFQVSELARKANISANTPLKSHGHHSPVVVFIANAELLQKKGSNMSLISCQAAADGDDEAVYMRLCLKEILLGQLDLQHWQTEAEHIPAALVMDCRGVHDASARSSSFCLGLKDKISGLEALALKQP